MKNEIYVRLIKFLESKTYHRYCEDGWYACPKNEEYAGTKDTTVCDCGADEAEALLRLFLKGTAL